MSHSGRATGVGVNRVAARGHQLPPDANNADPGQRSSASQAKKRVSPHVLRHSCAMMICQATGDLRKVALWLGHADMQTTEIYLRADPTEKLEVIAAMTPPSLRRGQFTVPDRLIAALRG